LNQLFFVADDSRGSTGASTILKAKAIDACCHLVDLEKADCNCSNFSSSMNCLVTFSTLKILWKVHLNHNISALYVQDDDACVGNDDHQDSESNNDLLPEHFKVSKFQRVHSFRNITNRHC